MSATTVAAYGTAESDFDVVGFSVSVSAIAVASVPTAKAKLKVKVEELTKVVEEIQKNLDLKFVKGSVRSGSSVQEKHEWVKNTQEFKGYEATYSFSFELDDLTKVNEVYEALTNLQEIKVNSPTFRLKNRDKLNKKALKQAFTAVQERFESECKVLGLDPAAYTIETWEASYSDSRRSDRVSNRMAMAQSDGLEMAGDGLEMAGARAQAAPSAGGARARASDPLDIMAGQATVSVNLEVGYVKKVVG